MQSFILPADITVIRSLVTLSPYGSDVAARAHFLEGLLAHIHSLYFKFPDQFEDSDQPTPPPLDYDDLRRKIAKSYPFLGPYNEVVSITKDLGSTRINIGDSVDDLADISIALQEFLWRLDHTTEQDAIWHFKNSFANHWSAHLIGLLRYLHVLTTAAVHHKES